MIIIILTSWHNLAFLSYLECHLGENKHWLRNAFKFAYLLHIKESSGVSVLSLKNFILFALRNEVD